MESQCGWLFASVSTAASGCNTLGVAVGPRQFVAEQLLAEADVIRAMHERVQLCQDPQTESAPEVFDEVGQWGFTENSLEQATLSAHQSGIGYKKARDVAGPAHLGALIVAKPRTLDMIHDAATAGLLPKQPLVAAWMLLLKQPPPPTLKHSTARRNPQLDCTYKKQPRQRKQTVQGHSGPTVTNPTVSEIEQSSSFHRMMMMTKNSPLLHLGKALGQAKIGSSLLMTRH